MIKAIIFDCFGVLVTESWDVFKFRHFKNNQEKSNEASKIMDFSNDGSISSGQFLNMIGELAGISPMQVQEELGGNVPNEPLFELIYKLNDDYTIALLSNVADDFLKNMFSDKQLSAFDVKALSYELKAIKPDPNAYLKTAELAGCKPEECIMVDDRESYVEGAKAVGMQAIVYKDHNRFVAELDKILKMPNTDK